MYPTEHSHSLTCPQNGEGQNDEQKESTLM